MKRKYREERESYPIAEDHHRIRSPMMVGTWKYAGFSWQLPLMSLLCGGLIAYIKEPVGEIIVCVGFGSGLIMTIIDFMKMNRYKNCLWNALGGTVVNFPFVIGLIGLFLMRD